MDEPTFKKPVTIQDVADAAGVTKATVSKVFNGRKHVSPMTVAAVQEAAKSLNFHPNVHAQRLSSGGRSNSVALFFLQADTGVNVRKVQLIQGLLGRQGYDVPAYSLSYTSMPEVTDQAVEIVRGLRRQRPRAIIVATLPDAAYEELARYQEEGGLVVSYDNVNDLDCDKVIFDREHSTYLATRHLLELGHRDIAFGAPGHPMPRGLYYDGYCRALQEKKCPVRAEWTYGSQVREFIDGLYEEGGVQIAESFLRTRKRPTAICITDDYASIAFACALQEQGIRVPQDVSVVGHDDVALARCGPVKLTTVTHPVRTIAERVVDLVTTRIDRSYDGDSRKILVQGELVLRNSTASP